MVAAGIEAFVRAWVLLFLSAAIFWGFLVGVSGLVTAGLGLVFGVTIAVGAAVYAAIAAGICIWAKT